MALTRTEARPVSRVPFVVASEEWEKFLKVSPLHQAFIDVPDAVSSKIRDA